MISLARATPSRIYSAAYFENGAERKISNYQNYTWVPDLIIPRAKAIIRHFNLKPGSSVLDYGCAKGFYVQALKLLGITAYGADISAYALSNCPKRIKRYLELLKGPHDILHKFGSTRFDLVMFKDVLEHCSMSETTRALQIASLVSNTCLVVVPIAYVTDGDYINVADNLDATHKLRLSKYFWLNLLSRLGIVHEFSELNKALKGKNADGSLCCRIDFFKRAE